LFPTKRTEKEVVSLIYQFRAVDSEAGDSDLLRFENLLNRKELKIKYLNCLFGLSSGAFKIY
jgi:hypothetical protein